MTNIHWFPLGAAVFEYERPMPDTEFSPNRLFRLTTTPPGPLQVTFQPAYPLRAGYPLIEAGDEVRILWRQFVVSFTVAEVADHVGCGWVFVVDGSITREVHSPMKHGRIP